MDPGQGVFLLPLADDDEFAIGVLMGFDDFVESRHFDAVDGDRTVGDVFAGLTLRFINLGIDEPVDDVFSSLETSTVGILPKACSNSCSDRSAMLP